MQLAKVSSELRHNATGPTPSILVLSSCRQKVRKYRYIKIKHSFPNLAAQTGLLFITLNTAAGRKEEGAEESQVDLSVPLARQTAD